MASVTENRPPKAALVEPEHSEQRFVDEQIRRTRRSLRLVDLTAGLITLVIGVLAYLLTMTLLEHWVVPGGWSPTARMTLLMVLVGSAAWFSWRIFWPLVSKPINPAFAAQTIEQSNPTLKNSLLNFLLLRDRRRQLSRQVYQAIEQQAAQRLSEVPIDSVVDRSAILRLGTVLAVVVAICVFYQMLSPKDPIDSAARLLMPWSNIPVPSRVEILDVRPGDTSAARGEQLVISAEVVRKSEDEPVRLRYSTTDGQIVDQEILMTGGEDALRYESRLPGRIALGGGGGLQSDLTYWIEAGDARSPNYKVTVFAQPTLVVQRIHYDYPAYTGYAPREAEFTGDISAVEGTIVKLQAVANQPIEAAHVDFEADGRHDLLMKSDQLQASVQFPLELRDDRRTPRYRSYVLRYSTLEGRKNPSPPKYRIDVQRDYPPEIELLAPAEEVLDVGLHDEVVIEVEARDPDFAVRNVAILGEVAGERVLKESLLSRDHSGRFVGQMRLVPAELDLNVGDVLQYWGAAADNRRPEPNLAFTAHQKLRIIGPGEGGQQDGPADGQQGQQPGEDGEGQEDQQGGEGQQGQDGQAGAGQEGESSGENQQQPGESGESGDNEQGEGGEPASAGGERNESQEQEGTDPSEGASGGESSEGQGKVSPEGDDDGEAFERIADHLAEREGKSEGEAEGAQGEAADQPQSPSEADSKTAPDAEGDSRGDRGPSGENAEPENAEQMRPGESEGGEGAEQDQSAEGTGAEGDGSQQQESGQQQEGDAQEDSTAPGGQMQENQGPSGAGEEPGENQGSPDAEGAQKPTDKQQDESGGPQENDQEAPAESQSKRDSDSEGGQGGDQSGGGQEGAGQQADADGTGGAGEHQAADDGKGQAAEPGAGEAGAQPGDQEKAEGETGESSGDQPGAGSQQTGEPASAGGDQSEASDQQPQENQTDPGQPGGPPQAGGTGPSDSTPPPTGDTQPGDDANLEYARKQTDLVIDTLEEQLRKQQVDEELLEKLGWTEDQLQRFVNRWKDLKSQAEGDGPGADRAQQELDDALRSLGLDRNRRPGFQSRTAKDQLRDLQEAYRGRTPLEYQELMRKYVKGTATAQEEE